MKQLDFLADTGEGEGTDERPALINAGLHVKIRERLDPSADFLSDEDIQKIMQMHYGNEDSIIRQCMLGISLMAEENRQSEIAVRFRQFLFAFEAGTFDINSSDSGVDS